MARLCPQKDTLLGKPRHPSSKSQMSPGETLIHFLEWDSAWAAIPAGHVPGKGFSSADLNVHLPSQSPTSQGLTSKPQYILFLLPRCCLWRWQPSPALRPLVKPKIVKKSSKKFIWHQSDRYVEIRRNWQKPQGIDNRARRRFKGQILMPNVGYRCNKKTKHMLPSGFWKFLVHSVKKPEVLPMCNESYCAQIAHYVSSKDCKATVERVAQLAIGVTNPNSRLCSEENE
ncbi:60S ribosomal protein L32-like [Phacochoerus africanus]|uniref:60S ribosomal protein L32-like n=1 Tax=Phacochoerus africanus TaxID=41426 RepID=UPI001FD9BCB6|nr:60S ribosomal protein L32-like [Phacochoerus africanus]